MFWQEEKVTQAANFGSPYDRTTQVHDMLEHGIMPGIGNGYSFVTDRRPEGHEDELIPPVEFTRYFSNRQIPIADADHKQRVHDTGHVASYQDMFGISIFADMVQASATNSLGDLETCRYFTSAIDGFGDAMRNITDRRSQTDTRFLFSAVNAARLQLTRLIELLPDSYDRASPADPDEALLDYIWRSMSLDATERSAKAQMARAYAAGYRDTGHIPESMEAYEAAYYATKGLTNYLHRDQRPESLQEINMFDYPYPYTKSNPGLINAEPYNKK